MKDGEIREAFLKATMAKRGCGLVEAEVILRRIADRLDGWTHAEVVDRNPLPHERDEACGTTAERSGR